MRKLMKLVQQRGKRQKPAHDNDDELFDSQTLPHNNAEPQQSLAPSLRSSPTTNRSPTSDVRRGTHSSSSISQIAQGSRNAWTPPSAAHPPAPLMGAVEPAVEVSNGELVYAPLENSSRVSAIRLLRIMPGQGDQQLQCSIIHTTLRSAANTYEALSYTWGDAKNNEDILIGETGARISVTANCASALRYLRYSDRPTLIWVDAVCINQKDVPERNSQLALMGSIYQYSNQVTIFLGDQSEDSDLIMDYLSVFGIGDSQFSPFSSMRRIYVGYEERYALRKLFNRPWFKRVWILQEVFMAGVDQAVMVCGDRWVDWSTVRYFQICIEQGQEDPGSIFDPIAWPFVLSLHERSSYSVRKDLVNFLNSTRHFGATDPRDRFFALLNLFSDAKNYGLVADYGLTTAQAYEILARFLIKHDLGILSSVQGFSDLEGLPSWACAWSQELKAQPLYPGAGSFTAGGTGCKTTYSLADATSQGDQNLVLHGILLGEVVPDIRWDYWVPNKASNFDDFSLESTLEQWDAMARYFRSSAPQPSVGNYIEEEIEAAVRDQYPILYAMTRAFSHPIWDRHTNAVGFPKVSEPVKIVGAPSSSDATASPTEPASQSALKAAHPFVSGFPIACKLRQIRTVGFQRNKKLVSWRKSTIAALQGRVFLGTKNGYYGLAPDHIKEKDIVCVFPGAPVPYALRPVGDKFKLIGECFVQGIMQGEILKDFGQSESTSKDDTNSQLGLRSFTII